MKLFRGSLLLQSLYAESQSSRSLCFHETVLQHWQRARSHNRDDLLSTLQLRENLSASILSRCTQQGEMRNTQTRKYFKIIVFNDNIKGRQGKVDTPGITSRPDEVEFKRQDLNTHSQITHTWNEWTHNYMKRTIYGNKRREHKTHRKHL